MAMISYADIPGFPERGFDVCDAIGRKIPAVLRFNADTGEVIAVSLHWRLKAWDLLNRTTNGRFVGEGADWILPYGSAITPRHGFWPAPLVVTPRIESEVQP